MVCRWRKGWSSRYNRAGSAKFGSNFWASRFLALNCPHQHHSFKSLQICSKTFVSVRLKLKIDLRRSSAVVCVLISGWDEGSFHVTILHDKVSYKKHLFLLLTQTTRLWLWRWPAISLGPWGIWDSPTAGRWTSSPSTGWSSSESCDCRWCRSRPSSSSQTASGWFDRAVGLSASSHLLHSSSSGKLFTERNGKIIVN